jgi:threonine/homoserine/homoserine lactone efflux protein
LIDTTTLGLFVGAAALLLITPGPAVLYIVARSVEQGRAAGIVSVLGTSPGRPPASSATTPGSGGDSATWREPCTWV